MTSTKNISVKVPTRVLRLIPPAGKGRSRFIISALEEKLARQQLEWQPRTRRGRRLAALLDQGGQERAPLLDAQGIGRELSERKGRFH